MKKMLMIAVASLSLGGVTGCQTISEDACMAGSWEDIGFKDGERGKSRSRLADIAEECGKYNVSVDRGAYIYGLEQGLKRYCNGEAGGENGFNDGRAGNTPNAECEALGSVAYMASYDNGYEVHLATQERDRLVDRWRDRRTAFINVRDRLETDEMDAKERRRLERKLERLERQMDDLRIEIRAIERFNRIVKWQAPDY